MQWKEMDNDGEVDFERRKFSNETMRLLKKYVDLNSLKSFLDGYNNVLDEETMYLADKRKRTEEEKQADRDDHRNRKIK